jgi:glutamate-1-semialdehyde aminotransferase
MHLLQTETKFLRQQLQQLTEKHNQEVATMQSEHHKEVQALTNQLRASRSALQMNTCKIPRTTSHVNHHNLESGVEPSMAQAQQSATASRQSSKPV